MAGRNKKTRCQVRAGTFRPFRFDGMQVPASSDRRGCLSGLWRNGRRPEESEDGRWYNGSRGHVHQSCEFESCQPHPVEYRQNRPCSSVVERLFEKESIRLAIARASDGFPLANNPSVWKVGPWFNSTRGLYATCSGAIPEGYAVMDQAF